MGPSSQTQLQKTSRAVWKNSWWTGNGKGCQEKWWIPHQEHLLQGPLQHRAEQSSNDWCSLFLRTGPCWEDEPSEPYNYFHGFISVHFLKMSFRDTELASHECCECQHSSKSGKWGGLGCVHPALSSVHIRAAANSLSFSFQKSREFFSFHPWREKNEDHQSKSVTMHLAKSKCEKQDSCYKVVMGSPTWLMDVLITLITRAICQDKGIIGFVKILFVVETINGVIIHRYIWKGILQSRKESPIRGIKGWHSNF